MSLVIQLICPHCRCASHTVDPTTNLRPMWEAAGIDFDALEGKTAAEIKPVLKAAIAAMEADPEKFKELNPPNGWGDYEGLLKVLRRLHDDCDRASTSVLELWK